MPAAARQLALDLDLGPVSAPAAVPARRQRVRLPWRLVASAHHGDAAVSVYVKAAALAARPEGCTAAVPVLARFLGMSVRTTERGLTDLINPDPDGVTELLTVRRTRRGGTGDTALRRPRQLDPGELWVWVPVAAADALPPRLLRAYAVLAYAAARRIPLTDDELAAHLRHQTGPRAGAPVSDRTARTIIGRLEAAGWISVDRRAGHQGRHLFTVHPHPLLADREPPAAHEGGSGVDHDGGSLATEEDHCTDRPSAPTTCPPAAGATHVSTAAAPVENPAAAPAPPSPGRSYTGPPLTFSGRVHAVLEPVRDLVADLAPFVARRIGREIGRQLDTEATVERLRHRLTARRAHVMRSDVRDPGRWLLGVALPRRGCPDPACESGVIWHTRLVCGTCVELAAERRTGPPPPLPDPAPRTRPPERRT